MLLSDVPLVFPCPPAVLTAQAIMLSREIVDKGCHHEVTVESFGDRKPLLNGSFVQTIRQEHDSEGMAFAMDIARMVEPGLVNMKTMRELP